MARVASLVMAVVLVISGCDGSALTSAPEDPAPAPAASKSASPDASAPATACPNESTALADRELVQPGLLDGDVDGDGSADEVRLVVDREGKPGCQAFVSVSTASGRLTAAITESDLLFDLGLPSLTDLVPVNDRPGDEVLVNITNGASTQFFGLFTALDGSLARMSIAQADASAMLFASGGSVGHLDATDCADNYVVVSSAVPSRNGYQLDRFWHTPEGADLIPEPTLHERRNVKLNEINRFPEFVATPFGSCG
jgi:hypothetical protein